MENSKKSKKRCPNYSAQEKTLLLNIVNKYKNVVLNQKTDAVSNDKKSKCWQTIAKEFNSQNPTSYLREVESLHRFFLNCVQNTRKAAGDERREMYGTGGGPKKNVVTDPNHELILNIINKKTVEGLRNRFDSDDIDTVPEIIENAEVIFENNDITNITILEPTPSTSNEIPSPEDCVESSGVEEASIENNNDILWRKYKPSDLRQMTTKSLQTRKKKADYDASHRRPSVAMLTSSHVAEKYNRLLDYRLTIAELEVNKLQAEKQYTERLQQLTLQQQELEYRNTEKRCKFEDEQRELKLHYLKLELKEKRKNFISDM